jgi:hypothetical protein
MTNNKTVDAIALWKQARDARFNSKIASKHVRMKAEKALHNKKDSDIALAECEKVMGIYQRHSYGYSPAKKGEKKLKKGKRERQAARDRAAFLMDNAARFIVTESHSFDENDRLMPAKLERVKTFQGAEVTGKRFDGNRFVNDAIELHSMPYAYRDAAEIRQEGTIREHRDGDGAFNARLFRRTERLRHAYQGTYGFAFHKAAFTF